MVILGIAVWLLFSALHLSAQTERAYRGAIIDSLCGGLKGHTTMLKPGETFAQCAIRCVKKGSKWVLFSPEAKAVFALDNQNMPLSFAARNVVVIGTLNRDTNIIHVNDIIAALPLKIAQAKSVYIDCDDCVRRMSKAKLVALQELLDWQRFKVVTDRRQADLIFLFASNPYLGDYITRDSPDARPVTIEVTFLDVIDPHTGQSLWSDSRRAGSWRVTGATKDLMQEFRAHVEAEQGNVVRLLLHYKKWNGESGATIIHDASDNGK